jgi:D-proline reductase (dithiol) PrdB
MPRFHLVGQLFSRVPALARLWGRRFDALRSDEIPFVLPRKPLRQSRMVLITTGGVHLRSQPPFDMGDPRGDPTFRHIPAATPPDALAITHDYYDHADADRDQNILFPLALFRELAQRGRIGALADGYGFMGHIEPPHVQTLLTRTAPEVAGRLKQQRVDCVLLTPA